MQFIKNLVFGKEEEGAPFLKFNGEGRFYIIEKEQKKCVFILASISFLQGKNSTYERFVHVKNLSSSSAYDTNEYFFKIAPSMDLRDYYYKDGREEVMGFEWDIEGGHAVDFEFSNEISNDISKGVEFREILRQLLYEAEFSRSVSNATQAQLDNYCMDKNQYLAEQRVTQKVNPNIDDLTDKFDKQIGLYNKDQQEEQKYQGNYQNINNPNKTPGKTLINVRGTLGELQQDGEFVEMVKIVNLYVKDYGNFVYYFEIYDQNNDDLFYSKPINNQMNYHVDHQEGYFKWVEVKSINNQIIVYASKLASNDLNIFKLVFAKSIFETNRQESFNEVFKKDDENYGHKYIDEIPEEDEEASNYDDSEIDVIADKYMHASDNLQTFNKFHTQAKLLDRTFVSNGSQMSVYRSDDDTNNLSHIVTLPPVKTFSGHEITSKKALMQEQDTKLVLVNEHDDSKVYYMDLEKGKVISEIEADGINNLTDAAPVSKHCEFTTNPCFVALNNRNIFKMDPRVSDKNKSVANKIYSKSPGFTCITTNNNENAFATGSKTGEIRLYKEVGQNAKNLYQGLGDGILGLDSTKDGKWLLATTHSYLVLLPTFTAGKDGYKQALGKDKKIPYKLTIKPEDMYKYRIPEVDFTPARFNDSKNGQEKYIITSTGNCIVYWTLKNILKGKKDRYKIKEIGSKIVSNDFRFNREDNIIVTLPNELRLQKAQIQKY